MDVIPVASSTLSTIAYDCAERVLQLEFRSSAIYQYSDVPASVHAALLRVSSQGRCFNQSIRGRFRYARATSTQAGKP